MQDSFQAKSQLQVGGKSFEIFRVTALPGSERLPFSLKILLENLLRNEDGVTVTRADIEALAAWDPKAEPSREIQYRPARVLMQDFTGVPAVVDLAAMRDAMQALGGDPKKINPLQPAELVIDHSVQVDYFGTDDAFAKNAELEFERNQERYQFLKWGQNALDGFKVVPPDTGIVHQINVEYLSRVVFPKPMGAVTQAYFDTCVGTDSHTTMVNGIGVLGWGVGGIEAEASMLGQPVSMLVPQVVGFRLTGSPARGRHRHRPGPDHRRHAAQARRGGQVRRVLRPRHRHPAHGRALHHRQHGARVRRHLRPLPGRSGDAGLPAPDRPVRGPDRPGRGLCQGPGGLPHRRRRRGRVFLHPEPGPGHRGPVPGRPQAAPGPRGADGHGRALPQGPGGAQEGAQHPGQGAGPRPRSTARRWRSRTAPSSSPPSPPAPTPPTPRS